MIIHIIVLAESNTKTDAIVNVIFAVEDEMN